MSPGLKKFTAEDALGILLKSEALMPTSPLQFSVTNCRQILFGMPRLLLTAVLTYYSFGPRERLPDPPALRGYLTYPRYLTTCATWLPESP